jgi:hypothetical protein
MTTVKREIKFAAQDACQELTKRDVKSRDDLAEA